MKIVIVDIDGTVSKVGDRIKHLYEKPCNWDSFYERCDEDKPVTQIVRLVWNLQECGYEIVYITGRRESTKSKTEQWLKDNNIYSPYLLMRNNGDFRHDTDIKPELLTVFLKFTNYNNNDVSFILEDRSSMVKKWRELGYTCLQVAEGDF